MNMSNARTFDRTTDSLEAISNALGIGPAVGLWMFGIVDATQVASAITVITNNLQNVPNDLLEGQFYMQVLYNTSAPGTAPEGETVQITNFVQGGALQTFTVDAFTANVEAGDMVCIFHQSLLPVEILGRGTLDTSSATVPADSTRIEVDNYFNGCLLMTTEGAVRFQPRRIVDYTSVGGIFTLDPNNPFTAVPGVVDYIIIGDQTEFIPAADGANNRTPADVIGGKADTAIYTPDAVSSTIRYLKGLMGAKIMVTGTADAGSDADTLVDAARTEADNYWNGLCLLMITGNNVGLARRIYDFAAATDSIEVRDAFPNAIAAGDVYVILGDYETLLPAADSAENNLVRDVIGNKTDTALTAATAADSLMRYIKGLLTLEAPTVMGKLQIAATTIDLNQIAGTYDLFTATAQDVVVEKLVLRCPALAAGGALTSISIQSDDATPIVLISSAAGAIANLTSEAQLAWTGAMLLDAGTGAKIRLTINGGATGVAYVCDVIAECRAVVAGGYLA